MILEILKSKVLEENKQELTWLQKQVCKFFKITPQVSAFYEFELTVSPYYYGLPMPNDLLMTMDDKQLMVTHKLADMGVHKVFASSVRSYASKPIIGDKLLIAANTFPEHV